MASLFRAKMLFLIRLAWEASEIQFSSVSFDQSCFNRFYLSWARDSVRIGSELGSVGLRMVVRLDSGLVSFLNSGHKDSNRLDSRLRSVCSRPGSARGSVQFAQGRISSRLGSSHHGARRGLLEARISSRLCSSHLGARLGSLFAVQPTSTRGSGSAWGSTRGSENQLNA